MLSLESIVLTIIILPVLLAAGGFVLNDIFDVDKDLINEPQKPIPSKSISKKFAIKILFIFYIISLILIATINSDKLILLFLVSLILTITYSRINKYNGILGNLITAFLSTIPWLAPAIFTNKITLLLIPALTSFCFVLSREILLDIKDISGDRVQKYKTLPIKAGIINASFVSFLLFSLIDLVLIFNGLINNYHFWYFFICITGFVIPTIILLFIIKNKLINNYITNICHISKFQFILGIIIWLFAK
jgi:geranylgeranylglycerol-phosphate geranylgeranyltransferase